ncbi:hypothetical protein [Natrinema pallidum]|uniref:Uncharacterized protein n=1 Tax=Natrinema pallidum TaxID=69527 RepID=A0A4P9TF21_9EURY|nr:hypothetical protein [Natrinema pallidum]QCW03259.1 hypothetical protein FGF80_08425 [Natrinema pallidum]
MDSYWSLTPPEGYGRHATVAILSIGLFIPGYVVQILLLIGLFDYVNIPSPYDLLLLAVGPALCIALLVGWLVKTWYGPSAAVGVSVVLLALYSAVFYLLETVILVF